MDNLTSKDLIKKAVIESYATAKFLNQYNEDSVSRTEIDTQLDYWMRLGKTKFGIVDKDLANVKVDMTFLLKGYADKALRDNCATLVRLVAPKGQEHLGDLLSYVIRSRLFTKKK